MKNLRANMDECESMNDCEEKFVILIATGF